jgi:hypothetical protein
MKPIHRWLCILALLLLAAGGCARRAQQTTGPRNVARQDDLPSWAPEHPSPEFLRAAKLLKAVPSEAEPYRPEFVPCWELFGSLTDQQIAAFTTWKYEVRSTRGMGEILDIWVRNGQARVEGDRFVLAFRWVSVPVKSLSPRQRQLLDRYAAVYGGTDQGPGKHDLLVDLYHAGAKQDLSNVDLWFQAVGHLVVMNFAGRDRPFPMIGSGTFAQLRESAAPGLREKLHEEPRAETGRAK